MNSAENHWTLTLASAVTAAAFALVGLGLETVYAGAAPLLSTALLVSSLGATGIAFTRLAMRVRRLEIENLGLIEEISQEFDRVKDKIELYDSALADPRSMTPEASLPLRRVTVK